MRISRIAAHPATRYLAAFVLLIALTAPVFLRIYGRFDDSRFRTLGQEDATQSLREKIGQQGAVAAWAYLQRVYLSDGMLRAGNSDAHSLAHEVGRALYRESGIAGLGTCGGAFTDGCYHGVIQEMITREGLSAMTNVGSTCLSQANPRTCAHGAGHGISQATDFDLATALSYCDSFPASIFSDCTEGAIMANGWTWKYRGDLIEKEPWAICMAIPAKYGVSCASGVGNYFANEAGKVYTSAYMAEVCMSAPTKEMSSICLERISQRIVKNAQGKAGAIKKECYTMPAGQHQACLVGAAEFERSLGYVDRETGVAELCKMFFADLQDTCPLK